VTASLSGDSSLLPYCRQLVLTEFLALTVSAASSQAMKSATLLSTFNSFSHFNNIFSSGSSASVHVDGIPPSS